MGCTVHDKDDANTNEPVELPTHRMKKKVIIAAFVISVTIVIAAMFVFIGLPNVAGQVEESATVLMLKHGTNRAALEHAFRTTRADWHVGQAWEQGESFGSPPIAPCKVNCNSEIQVAYTHTLALCAVWGDRVTILFDSKNRVKTWSVEPAADGC